ncbi:MAG: TRAP transporter small permease [Firmicutes bacterium]|nr:TRAP transporter small permease [Bacillota bacterium]
MERITGMATKICRFFDAIAGWSTFALMALVVANVLLREIFKKPILGTYEYVGFLAALVVGLALAYCAIQNGHIAVTFLLERFPLKMQAVVEVIIGLLSIAFLVLAAWHTGIYAHSMAVTGEVSPTTKAIFYPYIYLVAFSLLLLALVVLLKVVESIGKGVKT